MARLTMKDRATIRAALNDAMDERASFADAYSNTGPEAEEALKQVREYEALHVKMFGEPSYRQSELDRFAAMPSFTVWPPNNPTPPAGDRGQG